MQLLMLCVVVVVGVAVVVDIVATRHLTMFCIVATLGSFVAGVHFNYVKCFKNWFHYTQLSTILPLYPSLSLSLSRRLSRLQTSCLLACLPAWFSCLTTIIVAMTVLQLHLGCHFVMARWMDNWSFGMCTRVR